MKEAYLELHYLRGAVEITRDTVRLLEQLEEIARTRYAVAAASYLDVIRIQIELEKVSDRLRELEDLRRPAAARLNAALDRRTPRRRGPTRSRIRIPRSMPLA